MNTMIACRDLCQWMSPRFTHGVNATENAQRNYEQFAASNVVVLDDFLLPEIASRFAKFVAQEAEFEPVFGATHRTGGIDQAEWEELSEQQRLFSMRTFAGVNPQFVMSPNWITFLKYQAPNLQRQLGKQLGDILGYPTAISDLDQMLLTALSGNQYLRMHTDRGPGQKRKLCTVVYLSPDWTANDGGCLQIRGAGGDVTTIAALFNRCVLFEPQLQHAVTPFTTSAEGKTRYSLTTWYV